MRASKEQCRGRNQREGERNLDYDQRMTRKKPPASLDEIFAGIFLQISDDGGAHFSAPVRVDGGNPGGRVDVGILADGSALVTWLERTGGEVAVVRGRRVTPAGKAGTPVTIATSSGARASGFPRLAVTGSTIVFAWTQPGQPSQVRVARAQASEFGAPARRGVRVR